MEHINQNLDNEGYIMTEWDHCTEQNPASPALQTSMSTLIIWNISKAIEKNPHIELETAIKTAQERLESDSRDVDTIISQNADERHIACAVLAWHHMGHKNVQSLCRFIETRYNAEECGSSQEPNKDVGGSFNTVPLKPTNVTKKEPNYPPGFSPNQFDMHIGPVVKLPVETTFNVMRLENTSSERHRLPSKRGRERKGAYKDLINKIDEACCMESGCTERLAALDVSVAELRTRAAQLARREAERGELLERAETAWKDLERGYQRRLTLAEEKEEDMTRQTAKLIEERNGNKSICLELVQQLKTKGEAAEKARANLTAIETQVCARACIRLRLSEESAKEDATLADYQCKCAQLDRDLQFKEEQARRKQQVLESEVDSARALTFEAERAMRSELSALKEQVAQVSNQLLEEDAENGKINITLEELRKQKMDLVDDLEGCKVLCDNRRQKKVDELKKKRDQLEALKKLVVECHCHLPVDMCVEAKRTPSLAALCKCTPADRFLDTCSCTSLRSSLLSNLLSDLFGGLQSELICTAQQMPCQLLKCLEDKHNWDRASLVKTNLKNYFSNLLIGELDIAIATAIEKYHARWIGSSCVDVSRRGRKAGESDNEEWQKRAVERRAQTLANEIAEKMFKDKTEEIMQKAKDVVAKGPPPCECCKPTIKPQLQAMYPCILDQPLLGRSGSSDHNTTSSVNWKRTHKDVLQLKVQIEDLKKVSVKKEDLMEMEKKITELVHRVPVRDSGENPASSKDISSLGESRKRENKNLQPTGTDRFRQNANANRPNLVKKKQFDTNSSKHFNKSSFNQTSSYDKQSPKYYKRPGQSFAVNMCLCGQKDPNKIGQKMKLTQSTLNETDKITYKPNISKDLMLPVNSSNIRNTKPIAQLPLEEYINQTKNSKDSTQYSCRSDCICFHKIPSNTSIDRLLQTLAKWKCDLTDSVNGKGNKDIQESGLSGLNKMKSKNNTKLKNKNNDSNILVYSQMDTAFSYNLSGQVENNNDEVTHQVPAITDSEYIGTINLDKSNDNVCKCPMYQGGEKSNNSPNLTFKCLGSCVCCNEYIEVINEKEDIDRTPEVKTQLEKEELLGPLLNHVQNGEQSKGDFQNITVQIQKSYILENTKNEVTIDQNNKLSILNLNPSESVNDDKINENTLVPEVNQNDHIKTPELFPCNSDYHVQFLGVTLTNNRNEDAKESQHKKYNTEKHSNIMKSRTMSKSHDHSRSYNSGIGCNEMPTRQRNVNIDEFKNFFDNTLQYGDQNINIDKSVDTQILKESISEKQSPFVYCKTDDSKESNDLEVNTFTLLEEHLKEKLEKFKSNCQSSCISSDEEEKLFSTIAQKIKQVVIENTSKVGCKCSEEYKSEGSWTRAFSLMQEYLKAKIKHVQCLCTKESSDTILPDVTQKICNLIESDFQQLKNNCKCININKRPLSNEYLAAVQEIKFQLPEKDTSNVNKKELINVPEMKQHESNSDITYAPQTYKNAPTLNISSQAFTIIGTNTRSCEAKQDIPDMKTVGTRKSVNVVDRCSESKRCQCRDIASIERNLLQQEIFALKESLVNQSTNALKTTHDNPVLPDMGDTKSLLHNGNESGEHSARDKECNILLVAEQKEPILDESITKTTELTDKLIDKNFTCPKTTFPSNGNTVDFCCDHNLDNCVSSKSIIQENDTIDDSWKSLTSDDTQKEKSGSTLKNVSKKCDDINYIKIDEDSYVRNMIKTNHPGALTTCDTKVSAHEDFLDIKLKQSKNEYPLSRHITTNTSYDDVVSNGTDYTTEDPLEWYECRSQPTGERRLSKTVHFPGNFGNNLKMSKSETTEKTYGDTLLKVSSDCACNMVPICHVKMLMDNIESKLVHSECTCDSLSSKVCPVHAKRSMY